MSDQPETAREILEAWKKRKTAEAFLDQVKNAHMQPNPSQVTQAIIEFIALADTKSIIHLWDELCDVIDRHGDTSKFRKWMLENGKEEYQAKVMNDEGI